MSKAKFIVFLAIVSLSVFSYLTCCNAQQDSFDLRADKMGDGASSTEGNSQSALSVVPFGTAMAAESNDSIPKEADLITVNFENVDIRDVVRILADKAQLNMVVGPEVSAVVNLQLSNVTWDKALDVILKTYNLTYKRDEDLIRVMTAVQLQQENETVPLETKILTLNFARASEIKGNFQNMLSGRGKIDVNDRTNSLIITDIPDNIIKIEEIANRLDTRTPQVMIEALLVDVKVTSDDQLGIEWNLQQETSGEKTTVEKLLQQELGSLSGLGGIFSFGTTILTDKDLDATIAAWQRQSRGKILAHPQVMTLDNLPAKINLTEEIPYQQTTQSTQSSSALTTTAFKEGGISLSVTPHITTKDNFIYLSIDVKQSFRSGTFGGQPIIDTRAANTNLLVKNRETAVIGGLRKIDDTFEVNKFPILGDIPLIGAAFRSRTDASTDTDLMIFITPTIVEDVILTTKAEDRLALAKDEEQQESKVWIKRFDPDSKKTKRGNRETVGSAASGKTDLTYFYLRPPVLSEDSK